MSEEEDMVPPPKEALPQPQPEDNPISSNDQPTPDALNTDKNNVVGVDPAVDREPAHIDLLAAEPKCLHVHDVKTVKKENKDEDKEKYGESVTPSTSK